MKFNIIIKEKLNQANGVSVFNSFYLQESGSGNCFPCNLNYGNGYFVAKVELDNWNQEVVIGEMKTFENSNKGFEEAVNYSKTLK